MKIDLSLAPLEKDGPSRSPIGSDGDRGAMGDAFGRAVRDAEGKRSANSNEKTRKSDADRKVAAETEPNDETDVEPATEGDPEVDGETETAPLQSLLGALSALTTQKTAIQDGRRNAGGEGKEQGGAHIAADPTEGMTEGLEASAVKDKGAMKLDVLRMETHFEPRQDGMVLVEGSAKAKTDATAAADPKGKTAAAGLGALAATLADVSKAKTADGKTTTAEGAPAASKSDGMPPMRFDEALARLGRDASDRSGGDSNRDGSAAARSALAELAARRSSARSADTVSVSGPGSTESGSLPSSSPYNLAGQVAGPIMEALGDPAQASAAPSSTTNDAHLRMRAGGGALKTLTIQLHPEHLGTVDVSLRLNEGRLTLELAASRSDTASMLLDDQASLRKLLEHAGFSLDDAAISVVTRDSGQIRTADSSSAGSPQRDASGSPSGEGRSETRGQSGGSDDPSGRRRSSSRGSEDATPAKSPSASTYL